MTAVLPIDRSGIAEIGRRWPIHLAVLGGTATVLLLLFHRDAADIVRIWLESSTFNHCILILPIIAWLVLQRGPQLRQLTPTSWSPGLIVVGAGACAWLLGEAGSVALARHIGLIVMLQGAVIACLGKAVARGLAFPIFYAVFLIPAGEELVPVMQTITARICMALLGGIGIPAHLDGVFITTPSGYFEVAEACSGVKFLVAMLAYGALVANLCFRSWPRRLAFMAAAIFIPILANGVRAWGTIYIASLTSLEFADGFDHVLYGWIFFAIVIAVLMASGWPFFDRGANEPWFDPANLEPPASCSASPKRVFGVAAAVIALAIAPIAWSEAVAAAGVRSLPPATHLPSPPGWTRISATSGRPWQPHFAGADRLTMAHYRDAAGHQIDFAIAIFSRQQEKHELVGFGQGPIGPESRWAWTASGEPPPGGRLDRIASFGTIREVATFYRVGQSLTGSPFEVKVETTKARLLGGRQRAVAVLVSAEAPADGVSPRPAIDAFLTALGPIDRLADQAAGGE